MIVNCSVLRPDRKVAFDVNTTGTYNAVRVAAEMGHTRFINTGPHFTQVGPSYEHYDFDISEEVPLHSGLNLYAHSKSIGQEICRVFSANYPLHVLTTLFLSFRDAEPPEGPARQRYESLFRHLCRRGTRPAQMLRGRSGSSALSLRNISYHN